MHTKLDSLTFKSTYVLCLALSKAPNLTSHHLQDDGLIRLNIGDKQKAKHKHKPNLTLIYSLYFVIVYGQATPFHVNTDSYRDYIEIVTII